MKGAPEFNFKKLFKIWWKFDRKEILDDIKKEGQEGKRVLALAFKKINKDKTRLKLQDEKGLTFLGYFVFEDPIKINSQRSN